MRRWRRWRRSWGRWIAFWWWVVDWMCTLKRMIGSEKVNWDEEYEVKLEVLKWRWWCWWCWWRKWNKGGLKISYTSFQLICFGSRYSVFERYWFRCFSPHFLWDLGIVVSYGSIFENSSFGIADTKTPDSTLYLTIIHDHLHRNVLWKAQNRNVKRGQKGSRLEATANQTKSKHHAHWFNQCKDSPRFLDLW